MSKDAAIIKVLTQLGLRPDGDLSAEEEKIFKAAIDPEEQYLQDLESLFIDPNDTVD